MYLSTVNHNVLFYRILLTTGDMRNENSLRQLQVLTKTFSACLHSNDIWDPMRLLNNPNMLFQSICRAKTGCTGTLNRRHRSHVQLRLKQPGLTYL